jgi:hypothetical protein
VVANISFHSCNHLMCFSAEPDLEPVFLTLLYRLLPFGASLQIYVRNPCCVNVILFVWTGVVRRHQNCSSRRVGVLTVFFLTRIMFKRRSRNTIH